MARIGVFPLILFLFFLSLCIPVLIGVYVYRDAARRGMNAALWVLVAILAPGLLGFIIYLLIRGGWSDLRCPRCGNPVKEQYVVCPKCGGKLRPACPNCAEPVETDWSVCPRCAQPLPKFYEDVTVPERPRDRTLWKIVLVVLFIPVLLIALLLVSFTAADRGSSWSSGAVTLPLEDFFEVQEDDYIRGWIDSLEEDGRAYVLEYARENAEGQSGICYLIYIPGAGSIEFTGSGLEDGLWSTNFYVNLTSSPSGRSTVCCIELDCGKSPVLHITLNGSKLESVTKPIAFDPIEGVLN